MRSATTLPAIPSGFRSSVLKKLATSAIVLGFGLAALCGAAAHAQELRQSLQLSIPQGSQAASPAPAPASASPAPSSAQPSVHSSIPAIVPASVLRPVSKLSLKSSAAVVLDQASGEILYGKNAQAIHPIASISKLMTSMVVLDAQRLEEGPLATVRLPTRIPGQVHGWWVPGSTLPATRL